MRAWHLRTFSMDALADTAERSFDNVYIVPT